MFDRLLVRSSVLQPNAYADFPSRIAVVGGSVGAAVPRTYWLVLRCLRYLAPKHSPLERVFLGEQYVTVSFFRPRNLTALVGATLDV